MTSKQCEPAIGLLMLDTNFQRIEGDIANKATFKFPVIVRRVQNASSYKVTEGQGKGLIDASDKQIDVPNLGDHRICMSAFVLASLTGAKAKIKNFETVYTSSPSFLNIMKKLGAKFEIKKIS